MQDLEAGALVVWDRLADDSLPSATAWDDPDSAQFVRWTTRPMAGSGKWPFPPGWGRPAQLW